VKWVHATRRSPPPVCSGARAHGHGCQPPPATRGRAPWRRRPALAPTSTAGFGREADELWPRPSLIVHTAPGSHEPKRSSRARSAARRTRAPPGSDGPRVSMVVQQLVTLIAGLESLRDGLMRANQTDLEHGWSIPKRLAFAEAIERLRRRWCPRARLGDRPPLIHARYPELDLAPQLALVPLARTQTPASGSSAICRRRYSGARRGGRLALARRAGSCSFLSLEVRSRWVAKRASRPERTTTRCSREREAGSSGGALAFLLSKFELTQDSCYACRARIEYLPAGTEPRSGAPGDPGGARRSPSTGSRVARCARGSHGAPHGSATPVRHRPARRPCTGPDDGGHAAAAANIADLSLSRVPSSAGRPLGTGTMGERFTLPSILPPQSLRLLRHHRQRVGVVPGHLRDGLLRPQSARGSVNDTPLRHESPWRGFTRSH